MVIKNIKIKNFKSFGNNLNEININPTNGELILISGGNGQGKSSILESFEYVLYGKVRGKKKKYVTNDALPNRYNKNLEVELEFTTAEHTIGIRRTIGPNKLELTIDHQPYDRAGKSNVQAKIEEIIGIDIDTFKSFISMSINDFKNFMVLTPDEKRMLLDRLFNLDMINELAKIIKEKKRNIAQQGDVLKAEIRSYEHALATFQRSMEKVQDSAKKNIAGEIEQLKENMATRRDEYEALRLRVEKGTNAELNLRTAIQTLRDELSQSSYIIQDTRKKVALFESGKCPTCQNEFSPEANQAHLATLYELLKQHEGLKATVQDELGLKQDKYDTLRRLLQEATTAFGSLKSYLMQMKTRIAELKDTPDQILNESITELVSNLDSIGAKRDESAAKLDSVDERVKVVEQLGKLFSEDGIKKSIISKIVVPLNHYIKNNLEKLDIPFSIRLDDQFTAVITLLGQEIDADTLSTGETKLANICIMLSYIQLIRSKKHINLLFLDEVFSSIDVENIYRVLELLKEFATEHNINIFLIHHALLEKSYFDKIYRVEKDVTSKIILDE